MNGLSPEVLAAVRREAVNLARAYGADFPPMEEFLNELDARVAYDQAWREEDEERDRG